MDVDIESALKECASAEKREVLMRFFKTGKGQYGEGDLFIGVKVPEVRKIVCRYWKECEWEQVEGLVTSRFHEVRLAGLLVMVRKFKWAMRHDKALAEKIVLFYLSNTAYVNNWDLVDLSCYEILGRWVLEYPGEAAVLERLARSANLWEQRMAIVSTMLLVRHGKLELTLSIADMLLHHRHDLIHKAVGWMLREVGKRDRGRLEEYLGPRYRTMPRTMLRYAIEKFPEDLRKGYLAGTV